MNRIGKGMLALLMVLMGGCATGPYTPMNAKSLDGDKLIYFEQADRIPKDVMLEAWKHQPVVATNEIKPGMIPPEIIAAIVKEVLETIPKITGGYQNERMNEALFSRRMLFRGYKDAELNDINNIVKSMGWCFEYLTPQNKTVPPPALMK